MTVIKGISNFGTPYYTDEPRYERKNGQWVDTKAGVIEELENIKTEIGRIETEEGGDFLERPAIDIIYEAQKIIDKHIAELKGGAE